MSENFKSDYENYIRMSQPHENEDKANDALKAFYDDVSEARKKHNICNVLIVVKDSVINNGDTVVFMSNFIMGAKFEAVSMAAYAYGQLQAEEREAINKLLAGGK